MKNFNKDLSKYICIYQVHVYLNKLSFVDVHFFVINRAIFILPNPNVS
jgi:hypothetical protein